MFIVFEGPEGSGKSTQAALAEKALRERGIDVLVVREPGGTAVGEGIRALLLDPANDITTTAEVLLFMASRAQLVEEVIRPALQNGLTVIAKRYVSSTIAYQGCAGGEDVDTIARLGEYATGGLKPDITILLDIDAEAGLARVDTPDRMEKKGVEYHRKVRNGFLKLAEQHSGMYHVVDAGRSVREVYEDVMKAIEERGI